MEDYNTAVSFIGRSRIRLLSFMSNAETSIESQRRGRCRHILLLSLLCFLAGPHSAITCDAATPSAGEGNCAETKRNSTVFHDRHALVYKNGINSRA